MADIKDIIEKLLKNLKDSSLHFEDSSNCVGGEHTCIKSLIDFSKKLNEDDLEEDPTLPECIDDDLKKIINENYWENDHGEPTGSWKPSVKSRKEITEYSFMKYYQNYKSYLPTNIIIFFIYKILHGKDIKTFTVDGREDNIDFNFINFKGNISCNTDSLKIDEIHYALLDDITSSLENIYFYDERQTKALEDGR